MRTRTNLRENPIFFMKKPPLCFIAILCIAAVPGSPAAGRQGKFLQEIARLEAEYGGHLGFMARNLKTGETLSYNGSERFPTASVIKLPVLAAFFHLVDERQLDPNEWITLTKTDIKPGSGVLQHLAEGDRITLLDAVKLMITQSDNTATNLVLDRLAPTHPERLAVVNDFVAGAGLKNTRILNRLFSFDTKQRTPEAIRYGIGVSTPEDMVTLLERLYARTLVSPASCDTMANILQNQFYREMIPRFLPEEAGDSLTIGNKTGSVNETKVDVALVRSVRGDIALAVFVDKHPDHRGDVENRGTLLGARVARATWNYFTGSVGSTERRVPAGDVDWNTFPGGRWGIYRSPAAPFPHPKRRGGFKAADGTRFPNHPHYDDNSIVVVVPQSFRETENGVNMIVHLHGGLGDNMSSLEEDRMPQALTDQGINAILVLPQGPYRANDSFWGKLTDPGGLHRLVEDALATMKAEKVVQETRLYQVILSAEGTSGQSVPAVLQKGGVDRAITDLFFLGTSDAPLRYNREWEKRNPAKVHSEKAAGVPIYKMFESFLKELGPAWKADH
jgi:beta-lactamase class A